MKKLFFTLVLAIVSSVWVMSEAQCLVPSTEQEGPFVEELTGLLCLDAYPCPYEENCPTCLTMVLRTKEKKYYLTGSVMESIDAPTDRQYVKVVVSGITGSTDLGDNMYYNWLKVETLRYSEEPVTTNIRTFGYVEDESGTRMEGIRVIIHAPERTVSDTVYTHEGGLFESGIRGIAYPVDSMYVTVSDVSGRFKEQTKSTTYTYECGVEFNPETDTGLNSKELLFVLQEKEKSASLPSLCDEWNMLVEPFMCDGPYCDLSTTIFRLTTDTIINAQTYVKLEMTEKMSTTYRGALREGTNHDIYFIPAESSHEYLMYAFNAQVGDRLTNLWIGGVYYECPDGYSGTVTSISDGMPRIFTIDIDHIEDGSIPPQTEWIEGVGFTDNPTGKLFFLGAAVDYGVETILCAYKDGEQVYASELSKRYGCQFNGIPSAKPFPLCDEWNILEVSNTAMGPEYESFNTIHYRFTTDTIINGIRYARFEQDGVYKGAMREGYNNDIYYIPAGSTHEYLLYAFNAKVGDKLKKLWFGANEDKYYSINSATVVNIESTTPRKFTIDFEWQIIYSNDTSEIMHTELVWLEGIGFQYGGPLNYECPFECAGAPGRFILCAYKNGEQVYVSEFGEQYGCEYNYDPYSTPTDTIPLYIKDGPGTSTVEPVDPNQIVATLVGDMLSIYEYIGAEIGYKVSKAPTGNNMPARGKEMADDTFSESVSIQLKERGLYTLELTNPEWGYTIVGTFEYDGMQGIEPVETGVPAAQKILRNGQLLIQKGDRIYTVQGIEIQ